MARVIFQAQVNSTPNGESLCLLKWIEIPQLCRQHCVLDEFKSHTQWRKIISTSEIDDALEEHIKSLFGETKRLDLDAIPDCVSVDLFGSLAIVTINLA
ncbi:TPA: hypothetical protein ACNU17_002175 [Aeromonas salmonicida subsp. pectinolytica]